jgi:hypothetical protein
MTEKNNEIRPNNLTIMHALDNFASFYLIHLKHFSKMSPQMLLGLPPLSPFSMPSAPFRVVSRSHLNRPLRMCEPMKNIIKLHLQWLGRKRMALVMSSLPNFAHLPCWLIESVEIKHTKMTQILLICVWTVREASVCIWRGHNQKSALATLHLLTYSMEQSPSWEANQWLCS